MTRLLILCLLFWPFSGSGEFDARVIHKIVATELLALKMPLTSPFCLAILPSPDNSETGADPSPDLLAFLSGRGMRPKKASTCYKAVKGNVISIELLPKDGGLLLARVAFADVAIPPGEDLGLLRRRGVYRFMKSAKGEWVIQSYSAEIGGAGD
jgi:hypothetical protein